MAKTVIVRIEHPVPDFAAWKREGFDSDPIGREKMGVRRYRIMRAANNLVMIDLEFDDMKAAQAFSGALKKMWVGVKERFAWESAPRVEIVELVEAEEYSSQ